MVCKLFEFKVCQREWQFYFHFVIKLLILMKTIKKYGPTTDAILNYFDYFTYSGKNFGHCTNPHIIEQETKVPLRGQRQTKGNFSLDPRKAFFAPDIALNIKTFFLGRLS